MRRDHRLFLRSLRNLVHDPDALSDLWELLEFIGRFISGANAVEIDVWLSRSSRASSSRYTGIPGTLWVHRAVSPQMLRAKRRAVERAGAGSWVAYFGRDSEEV